ncbi:hypothetical protein Tco_0980888, partial [Tanacetum coccineum]
VQRIESKAKTEGNIPSTPRQQPRQLPRGTTWLPHGSGGHHLTRPLTGGQPPFTVGPAVVNRWSDGGPVVVDGTVDRRWPPLTAAVYEVLQQYEVDWIEASRMVTWQPLIGGSSWSTRYAV